MGVVGAVTAEARRQINKVFPTHWSFLLGEIALYSFVILLVSGVYLTLFFDPSMSEVIYDGAYQPLNGVMMTKAYATTLDISFEVRGGLFVRQIHHWAALLFAAAVPRRCAPGDTTWIPTSRPAARTASVMRLRAPPNFRMSGLARIWSISFGER